jgi:hypothetical protein
MQPLQLLQRLADPPRGVERAAGMLRHVRHHPTAYGGRRWSRPVAVDNHLPVDLDRPVEPHTVAMLTQQRESRRGLARSRSTNQRRHPPRPNLERDPVDKDRRSGRRREVAHSNQRLLAPPGGRDGGGKPRGRGGAGGHPLTSAVQLVSAGAALVHIDRTYTPTTGHSPPEPTRNPARSPDTSCRTAPITPDCPERRCWEWGYGVIRSPRAGGGSGGPGGRPGG